MDAAQQDRGEMTRRPWAGPGTRRSLRPPLAIGLALGCCAANGAKQPISRPVQQAALPRIDSPVKPRPKEVSLEQSSPTGASARRLVWRHRPLVWVDFAVLGGLVAAWLSVEFLTSQSTTSPARGGVWFDDGIRQWVSGSRSGRNRAATASDFLWYGSHAWVWTDSLAVPLLVDRGNQEVAWRLSVINLQAYAWTALLTRGSRRLWPRVRPDLEPCQQDPGHSAQCFTDEHGSFPSGHSSGSFLAAGLLCAHHLGLGLYGSRISDAAVCAVGTVAAATTGMLRILADRHYASDVLAGAAIGLAGGLVAPWLSHYATPPAASLPAQGIRWTVVPWTVGDGIGVAAHGWL